MTADKNLKRLVRARMRRTGESYSAALRHLRRTSTEEIAMSHDPENPQPASGWRRVEKPEFGYAVWIPEDWVEQPPNLKNSPWETARFGQPDDRRRSGMVFRMPIMRLNSPVDLADAARTSLAGVGFGEFQVGEATVAGRPGARLDCARRDAGRVWAVREYLVVAAGASFCLGLGTSVPDDDAALFDELAARWEVVPDEPTPVSLPVPVG